MNIIVINKVEEKGFCFTTKTMAAKYLEVSYHTVTARLPYYETNKVLITNGEYRKNGELKRVK